MNAVDMAKRAYGASATPVRTPRNTEYALFARVTQRIRSAAAEGPTGFGNLAHALHENRKLWRILAVDVADDSNALPKALRAQIVYLTSFVSLHSSKILKGEATVEALVDINLAVMRGLGREGSAE